jgi:hypothetical protein
MAPVVRFVVGGRSEASVRKILRELRGALIGLTGAGAVANARSEIDRAFTSLAELEAQLGRIDEPPTRRAAMIAPATRVSSTSPRRTRVRAA